MRLLLCLVILLFSCQTVFSQDPNLANQYFINGEYEKAVSLYQKMHDADVNNEYYFNRLMQSFIGMEDMAGAEAAVKRVLKADPKSANGFIAYGDLLEKMKRPTDAEAQYQAAIATMAPDFNSVVRLASIFSNANKNDYAITVYEKGQTMLNDPNRFAFNLGELYRRIGNTQQMISNYIRCIASDPSKQSVVQSMLQRYLNNDDYTELQSQLYSLIQTDENNTALIEMLAWSFMQQKDYKNALRQLKAIDKRLNENGSRIHKLATDAANDRDYDAAISGYEYILNEKGEQNTWFYEAKREVMQCRRKKITEGFNYTNAELKVLESEYEGFLAKYPLGKQTATIVMNLAELEALYLNNIPKAVALLDTLIIAPGLDRNTRANAKITLADYYLIQGEIWESTLLYSQVDKDLREEQLGQEARFKNARLSYFNGDFEWAQAQFDVLKSSTSKLIANDALDLSVFITDNLVEDSTGEGLKLYSDAELLMTQHKYDEALTKLAELKKDYPSHALQDDLLYLEARIKAKRFEWQAALDLYTEVADKYKEDIRADNALYAMAEIYELHLNQPEKAKGIYERIFNEFSGSVFAVESRKRFRRLRGDKVN
jgi:TolA-binding protein/thioredoxin-like negative regulator of GroEL